MRARSRTAPSSAVGMIPAPNTWAASPRRAPAQVRARRRARPRAGCRIGIVGWVARRRIDRRRRRRRHSRPVHRRWCRLCSRVVRRCTRTRCRASAAKRFERGVWSMVAGRRHRRCRRPRRRSCSISAASGENEPRPDRRGAGTSSVRRPERDSRRSSPPRVARRTAPGRVHRPERRWRPRSSSPQRAPPHHPLAQRRVHGAKSRRRDDRVGARHDGAHQQITDHPAKQRRDCG